MNQSIHNPKCKDIPKDFWYPANSLEKDVLAYRLTFSSNNVCADDFLSKYELDKRDGKNTSQYAGLDKYYGVSVYENLSDALKLITKVPAKRSILHGIACGYTKNGRVRLPNQTATKSHITWWLYEDAAPETEFIMLEDALNG